MFFRIMVDEIMGLFGGFFMIVIYFMLLYMLFVVYILKLGEVFFVFLNVFNWIVVDVVFIVGFGSLLCVGGVKMVDFIN